MHLYVHVPFCARRCSYCDFAIAVRHEPPSDGFVTAILREWVRWQSHPAWDGADIATIYFGGGTPSRLAPAALAALLDRFRADRPVHADAEVTVEANPDDVTARRAAAWRAAGVNRVSLGVQSFQPAALSWMHRTHGPDESSRAVATLRAEGFASISLDLIFGLPPSIARSWTDDLDRALALAPEHLSLYGLTVEDRTPLGRWVRRGRCSPPEDGRYAAEYLAAHDRLTQAGFRHYEVSNAALPGHEARHNSAYWHQRPYIGLGPSAHSSLGGTRSWNVREWAAYERAALANEPVEAGRETISPDQERLERLYLGLRTADGVPSPTIPDAVVEPWLAQGWASRTERRVRLTPQGWLRLDALVHAAAGSDPMDMDAIG